MNVFFALKGSKLFIIISFLQTIEDINVGLVRMYVTLYRISWIIFRIWVLIASFPDLCTLLTFTSDLVISYTDKLLVFRWVQIVLLL